MKLKAVIFDKDGVLTNSEKLKAAAWQQTLESFGVDQGFSWYLSNLGPTSLTLAALALRTFEIAEAPEKIASEWNARYREIEHRCEAIDENLELLARLSRDYVVAVASSMDKTSIEGELERFGYRQYVRECVSGEDVRANKPAPDIYLEAMARLGVAATDCIAIEDSPTGVRSAKAAGIFCIGYKNPLYNLDLGEADVVSNDLSQLDFGSLLTARRDG